MTPSYVSLRPRFGETRRSIDEILLPRPGDNRTQMFSRFVGSTTRIGPLLLDGTRVNPVEEFANLTSSEPLDGDTAAPFPLFSEPGSIFVSSTARGISGTKISLSGDHKRGWHRRSPRSPTLLLPDPFDRQS
jgi:hypothetical protein